MIEPDTNPITREPDYSQIYVCLPDKAFVKKLYDSQPFFGCLLVHKLTHPCLGPFVKYSKEVCIISDSEKSAGCIKDMNHDACSRQLRTNLVCPASAPLAQKIALKHKGRIHSSQRPSRSMATQRSASSARTSEFLGAQLTSAPLATQSRPGEKRVRSKMRVSTGKNSRTCNLF